jgi:hypothetical protein
MLSSKCVIFAYFDPYRQCYLKDTIQAMSTDWQSTSTVGVLRTGEAVTGCDADCMYGSGHEELGHHRIRLHPALFLCSAAWSVLKGFHTASSKTCSGHACQDREERQGCLAELLASAARCGCTCILSWKAHSLTEELSMLASSFSYITVLAFLLQHIIMWAIRKLYSGFTH